MIIAIGIMIGRCPIAFGWDEGLFAYREDTGEHTGVGLKFFVGKHLYDDED